MTTAREAGPGSVALGIGIDALDPGDVGAGDRRMGEMQRVAIARALIVVPVVVLADEPTGNLDSKTGTEALKLLERASLEHAQTIVMVTHDPRAAAYGNRILTLRDGTVEGDTCATCSD